MERISTMKSVDLKIRYVRIGAALAIFVRQFLARNLWDRVPNETRSLGEKALPTLTVSPVFDM
jgi:hypothetical protein